MEFTNLPNIIKYFQDCYQSDNRELSVLDFLDKKVENKVYIEGKEELLTGNYPIVPIDEKKGENLLKKAEIYQKEKMLIYGSFFIGGLYTESTGKVKRLCAPLFYYPAQVEENDGLFFLSINITERQINYPLLKLLETDQEKSLIEDPLFSDLPQDHITFEQISLLSELFKKYHPSVKTEGIGLYPNHISQSALKKQLLQLKREGLGNYVMFSTSMAGLVAKSENTRGVLNELNLLGELKDFSTPLEQLFTNTDSKPHKKKYVQGNIPIVLSEAQQAILRSGSLNPITLIIGPPGTGKTYTIGALAIEHMARGESVLIASRTDEAVDVIAQKIEEQLQIDKCVVRGGKKHKYVVPLRRFIKSLMTRVNKLDYLANEFDLKEEIKSLKQSRQFPEAGLKGVVHQLGNEINSLNSIINKIEIDFLKEIENELDWGDYLSKEREGLWHRLKTKFLAFRNKFQTPIWEYAQKLDLLETRLEKAILRHIRFAYISRVLNVAVNHWQDLKLFYEALNLHSDTEKIKKLELVDFNNLFKAFPIWLVNLSEVKNVLPFQKEMFDLLIIDEATQCDIASCLPLIQRAKRVVIAGDPNQLRHVSFLSAGQQHIFKQKHNLQQVDNEVLNYRDNSVLDLVTHSLNAHDQVAMLDEHFRSMEPIIRFSNQTFYENSLRIMTNKPDKNEPCIFVKNCKGVREKEGHNTTEADALMRHVRKLVDAEKALDAVHSQSIGILSPFRSQVDFLAKKLFNDFSINEIEKHRIRVGTAYGFQGEERDIMLLSFVVDATSHHSAFIHINKEDVFNVSITRARYEQHIFTSVESKELKGNSLLRTYFESINLNEIQIEATDSKHDEFLEEVVLMLEKSSIHNYWRGYHVAGLNLDLLLKHNDRYLGIDLVGYPGEFREMFGLERYRILKRADIQVFPLPYSDWYFDREATFKALMDFIEVVED